MLLLLIQEVGWKTWKKESNITDGDYRTERYFEGKLLGKLEQLFGMNRNTLVLFLLQLAKEKLAENERRFKELERKHAHTQEVDYHYRVLVSIFAINTTIIITPNTDITISSTS